MNLYKYLVIALVMSLSAAMGLVNYIQFGKYERTYSDIFQSRFGVVNREVVNSLERGLALGLPLRDLEQNIQTLVSRYRQRDPDIVAIHVTDERGQLIVKDGDALADTRADRQQVIGNAGDTVGEVAVYYRVTALHQALNQTWRQLMLAGVLSVTLGVILSMGLMRWLLGGVLDDLDRLSQNLDAVARGQPPTAFGPETTSFRSELQPYLERIWLQQQQAMYFRILRPPKNNALHYLTGRSAPPIKELSGGHV